MKRDTNQRSHLRRLIEIKTMLDECHEEECNSFAITRVDIICQQLPQIEIAMELKLKGAE